MSEEPKKIEVVSGNGKELEISDVSTHLSIAKPKVKNDNKKQEIVIPKVKKKTEKTDDKK